MTKYLIQDTTLTEIANAVRIQSGKSEPIMVANMASEILSMSSKVSTELLWKNASPSSAFIAQFVPMTLTDKNLFLIKMTTARTTSEYENECWRIYSKGSKYLQTDSIFLDSETNQITEAFRVMEITDTGFDFKGGYFKNSTNTVPYASDAYAIPLEIYHIKGVYE